MQSRLAIAATRSCWAFSVARNQGFQREFVCGPSIKGSTADPAIHSGEVEAGPAVDYSEYEGVGNAKTAEPDSHEAASGNKPSKGAETELLVPHKPPHIPYPRLSSHGVNQLLNLQQKRENTTDAAVGNVICDGLAGTPLPEGKEKERRERYETVEDDKEYYSHHKPTPLSEIKFVDSRKPITRATDGTADADEDYGIGRDVIGWRPEQLDTAEESLRRAVQIFRQNAMRGDPDVFPHSRVLRELRGEWF